MKKTLTTILMIPLGMTLLVACGPTESTSNAVNAVADTAKTAAADTVNVAADKAKVGLRSIHLPKRLSLCRLVMRCRLSRYRQLMVSR